MILEGREGARGQRGETIPHQTLGPRRHKMGHFLEWLKVWGLHLFDIWAPTDIFYAEVERPLVSRQIKSIPLQLQHCGDCLIALHVATKKG